MTKPFFGAYLTLLGRIGAHKAGYSMVMFPVVALIISFFFEGLEPGLNILAGVTLVIVGNVIILRPKNGYVTRMLHQKTMRFRRAI